jgi:hypothetical protein
MSSWYKGDTSKDPVPEERTPLKDPKSPVKKKEDPDVAQAYGIIFCPSYKIY